MTVEPSFRRQPCEHGSETRHQIGPSPDCGICKGLGWVSGVSGSDAYTSDCSCVTQCTGSLMVPDTRLQTIADAWSKPPLLATATGRYPDRKTLLQSQWPELAQTIKDALTEENNDG